MTTYDHIALTLACLAIAALTVALAAGLCEWRAVRKTWRRRWVRRRFPGVAQRFGNRWNESGLTGEHGRL